MANYDVIEPWLETGPSRRAHTLFGADSPEYQKDSRHNKYLSETEEEARLHAEWSGWRGELPPAIHRDANFLGCQAASLRSA